MKKLFLVGFVLFFSGCVNKHGVSLQYYSDCDEYYDVQGYYHKDCGKDDIFTYKEVKEKTKKAVDNVLGIKQKPKGNVW